MKNLFFQSLLLLSCLIAAQNLNAQVLAYETIGTQGVYGCSDFFTMGIEKQSSTDTQECFLISVSPNIAPVQSEIVVFAQGKSNVRIPGQGNQFSFSWCFDKLPNVFDTVWIGCESRNFIGNAYCYDGCIVIVDPYTP